MNAKHKGSRVEREIRKLFEEFGLSVVRSAGSFGKADLVVEKLGKVQVKARKRIALYKLLDGVDALVLKQDREEPLIVLPLKRLLEIMQWSLV